jgi:transmembrane 9 superfamily protein 2/4
MTMTENVFTAAKLVLFALLAMAVTAGGANGDREAIQVNKSNVPGGRKKRAQGAVQLAKRIQTRQKRFSKVKEKDGLSALLFPGVVPEEYAAAEEIPMWIDWVNSEQAQIPYNYYTLPVCEGPTVKKTFGMRKNLGAKLQGHNLQISPYTFNVKEDVGCQAVCMQTANMKDMRRLRQMVMRKYRVHASLDGLPVITINRAIDDEEDEDGLVNYVVKRGYPLGFVVQSHDAADGANEEPAQAQRKLTKLRGERAQKQMDFYLFNHIRFIIRYREKPGEYEGVRVVGFEAQPVSIEHSVQDPNSPAENVGPSSKLATCHNGVSPENNLKTLLAITPQPKAVSQPKSRLGLNLGNQAAMDIVYTYEVKWVESEIDWADRWDVYMGRNPDDKLHLFGILNSLVVVFCLSAAVALVLVRTLRKDIAYYNEQIDLGGDADDEGGWKLMHGDVFRPPKTLAKVLCVAVGTGIQILMVVLLTIGISVSGILPPMGKKGQLLTAALTFYVLMGGVAGYWSARLFKLYDLQGWKLNTILTAVGLPGVMVTMFLLLDICLAFKGASSAVSIWTIILLFFLWVCISSPLVFLGSFVGYRMNKIEVPTKTKQIARVIPNTGAWYIKAPFSVLIGGALPFASCVLEMFFIMEALWLHQIYYIMGFLFIVVFVVCVISAEVSMSMCYLQLIHEDHQWHWRAFCNSAGSGLYMLVYSAWFASNKLELIGVLPTMVYFTYMTMLSGAFGLLCGSVGFISTLYFTRKIYGSVKVD